MSKKYVYMFAEGNASMRELLGGKGANLAEMSSPVFMSWHAKNGVNWIKL